MRFVFTLMAIFLSCISGRANDTPRGIYRASEVPGSPPLLASGLAWSEAGLVIADREENRLVVLRPDDKFETLRKMTQPFGVAFDPLGKVVAALGGVLEESGDYYENSGPLSMVAAGP